MTVTDKDGNDVALAKVSDDKYTFTMPSSKVTVTPTFVESDGSDVTSPFIDVPNTAYYYDAIQWAVENGITTGKTATTFDPDGSCTRAQMVTFLWRYAGEPEVDSSNSFTDVENGKYFTDAVQWATENGITNGYSDGTFRPYNNCTKAQIVTFMYRDFA